MWPQIRAFFFDAIKYVVSQSSGLQYDKPLSGLTRIKF